MWAGQIFYNQKFAIFIVILTILSRRELVWLGFEVHEFFLDSQAWHPCAVFTTRIQLVVQNRMSVSSNSSPTRILVSMNFDTPKPSQWPTQCKWHSFKHFEFLAVCELLYLRNKSFSLCFHSLVRTEVNVSVNSRADQWDSNREAVDLGLFLILQV